MMKKFLLAVIFVCSGLCWGLTEQQSQTTAPAKEVAMKDNNAEELIKWSEPPAEFFENCAFISVDIQGPPDPNYRADATTDDEIATALKERGFTAADMNAGLDFYYDFAVPNARKAADICRELKLPMIFVHWGNKFKDGMDLEPGARKNLAKNNGPDPEKWPTYIGQPYSRPHPLLGVRDGEYVIAKADYNAFSSSNIGFVLQNLGVKNIIFAGGHTQGCLWATAKAAIDLKYTTLCLADATNNGRESLRLKGIADTKYAYVMKTEDFLRLAGKIKQKRK